jgi:hypothetical protein
MVANRFNVHYYERYFNLEIRGAPTYNHVRLNNAIGYITPKDLLAGRQQEIQAERDRKLDAAKEQRKNRSQGAA